MILLSDKAIMVIILQYRSVSNQQWYTINWLNNINHNKVEGKVSESLLFEIFLQVFLGSSGWGKKKFQIVVVLGLFQGKPMNSPETTARNRSSTPPGSGPTQEPLPLQLGTDTAVHSTDAGQWTLW